MATQPSKADVDRANAATVSTLQIAPQIAPQSFHDFRGVGDASCGPGIG